MQIRPVSGLNKVLYILCQVTSFLCKIWVVQNMHHIWPLRHITLYLPTCYWSQTQILYLDHKCVVPNVHVSCVNMPWNLPLVTYVCTLHYHIWSCPEHNRLTQSTVCRYDGRRLLRAFYLECSYPTIVGVMNAEMWQMCFTGSNKQSAELFEKVIIT